ncbi:hypothetical protein [Pseudomonas sp. D(2018)]|uniref:hypothetical protein n=1 Tax=Pseudomonas sp. D(2018) TaxID=2502238 RepID=UPI0010F8030C|nr:hypothetical protein [Pseudomonas sp. D(2018)]
MKGEELHPDLHFLMGSINCGMNYSTGNPWLLSEHSDDYWAFDFCAPGRRFSVDFDIELANGRLLIEERTTLNILKNWISLQGHSTNYNKLIPSPITAYNNTKSALQIIDALLLGPAGSDIIEFGIENIRESSAIACVMRLHEASNKASVIYDIDNRASSFLREKIAGITPQHLAKLTRKMPSILEIDQKLPRRLFLSDVELIKARTWLFLNHLYRVNEDYSHAVKIKSLLDLILNRKILNRPYFNSIPELCFGKSPMIGTEYPSIGVRDNGEQSSYSTFLVTKRIFKSLYKLGNLGLPIPERALNAVAEWNLSEDLDLKDPGRYASLDIETGLSIFRRATEFILEYGSSILDSLVKLALFHPSALGKKAVAPSSVADACDLKLRLLGVQHWSLAIEYVKGQRRQDADRVRELYYREFRQGRGLFELSRVLYGSFEIVIGTLLARRQKELMSLPCNCLDELERYIIVETGKSGVAGINELHKRPCPDLVVKIVHLIENFQSRLIKGNVLARKLPLLAPPSIHLGQFSAASSINYNSALTTACDFFETPLNSNGERPYIRQHQLRRLFAMLFFWGNSFGGLDTLRWFLSHSDVEHLYHYITETVPGEILTSAKAAYATSQILATPDYYPELQVLLRKHFGTDRFEILEHDVLEDYIAELTNFGKVSIEPHFFSDAQGKTYKIIIKVIEHEKAQ